MPSKINPHNKNPDNDNWTTPEWVWKILAPYIPNDKVIWEPFYHEGLSGEYLTNLGFNVIHKNIDFFDNDEGEILISNPPFTIKKQILQRLKLLNKPFIMLLPLSTFTTKFFRDIFNDSLEDITLFILPRRIDFIGKGNVYRISTVFLGYKVNDKKIIYM